MNPVSIFPVIIAIIIALLTAKTISKIKGTQLADVKYTTIDGLRGYLAFFVFIHHSSVWYFFLQKNEWNVPPTNLFIHFGQTSVALFFMITGFLFFSKLHGGKAKQVDWLRLFVSRIMRLVPLYFFVLSLLIAIVFVLSHFHLKESISSIIKEIAGWSVFTVYGPTAINKCDETGMIIAGVVWSLVYEWIFYLSLPIIGFLLFRKKASVFTLVVTVVLLISIIKHNEINLIHIYTFAGGIAASFLVRWPKFCMLVSKKIFSVIVLICLFMTVYFYQSPQAILPLILISIPFIIIACGNTLFGLLSTPISRLLGQMAYSIYLLHGMLLFITFRFVLGFGYAAKLTPIAYWAVIFVCTVFLIVICNLTYNYIEVPSLNSTTKVVNYIKQKYEGFKLSLKFKEIRK